MASQVAQEGPAPFVFGSQYVKKVISSAIAHRTLAEQILAVIRNTDFNVLGVVLRLFVEKFQDSSNQKQQQVLKSAIKLIINHYSSDPRLGNLILAFLNGQDEFPTTFLNEIPQETAFVLALYGCKSKFGAAAREFLKNSILSGLTNIPNFFVDNILLYELCALNIDGFDPECLFNRASSMDLMMFASRWGKTKTAESKLEKQDMEVNLKAVLEEADCSLLMSGPRLRDLLRFYQNFDHVQAAIFILSIMQPNSSFKKACDTLEVHQRQSVFQIYREVFQERNIDFAKMVYALDQPEFEAFPEDSCVLLFNMVCCLFEKQLIPSDAFTCEWKNKKLQYALLHAATSIKIPNLDFSKGSRQLNVFQLDLPVNTFSQSNNCWSSLDFAERVIQLSKDDENGIAKPLFKPLMEKSPTLVLAIFGQCNAPQTPPIMCLAIEALMKVMQAPNRDQVFAGLWKTSSAFLKHTMVAFYARQPDRVDLIFSAALNYLSSCYECEHIPFVVDLAIYASNHKKGNFQDFLALYIGKHGVQAIPKIVEFVRQKVTESVTSSICVVSDVLLNTLFRYLSDNGNSYPIEVRYFIQRAYLSCVNVRPKLTPVIFDVKYSAAKLKEIRQTASMNYAMLIRDEVTPEQFLTQMTEYRTSDPKLYSCMVYFLLKECNYLDKHSSADIEKLAEILGKLLFWNRISSDTRCKFLAFLLQALKDTSMTPRWCFACRVVTLILPKLSDDPQFVFDIVHESTLRQLNPQLFDKIHKLGQVLQEPSRSSMTRTVTVHPLLKKFDNLQSPPPRVCKQVQLMQKDPKDLMLRQLLTGHAQYKDWFALHIVTTILDQPKLARFFIPQINQEGNFWKYVFQAASSQVMRLVQSPTIDTYEGAFLRRRLLLLGQLIGRITVAVDRPLLSRFLDVKKLLLYGFSQGKLYAIVPFVCSIFMLGSKNYGARNPFVAGILQLLAAVLKADSIKLMIKQHILALFRRMNVELSMFATIPDLFPDNYQNNFDFLLPPFSLRHMASTADVERICAFDEVAFAQFAMPHIVIPDDPILQEHPEVRDKMRQLILKQAYQHVKTEGTILSTNAAATAAVLILKDFASAQETDLMIEDAVLLTKQLAAGLTLFTAPAKIPRPFCAALRKVAENANPDWLDQIAQQNYAWIVQLLRDVVEFLALREVHKRVDHSEEERAILLKQRSTAIQPYPIPPKQGLAPQQQHVYSEVSDIALSQQPFPLIDLQTKEKQVAIDQEFESYLAKLQKSCSLDAARDRSDDTVAQLLEQCPTFGERGLSVERLKSILKAILKWVVKASQPGFHRVICHIVANVCRYVPQRELIQAQSSVVMWIRTTLRSPIVIRELVIQHLVTVEQLDRLFTELLNEDPFNARNANFIIEFVYYAINEVQLFPANAVISTLSVLCALGPEEMEQLQDVAMRYAEELQAVFAEMDAPPFNLSSASKLQEVSTFDPLEDVQDAHKIADAIQGWKNVLSADNPSESDLEDATKECVAYGKNLFVSLLLNENEKTCMSFIYCVVSFVGMIDDLLEAIVAVISGNANVIGFDMRKYYSVLRLLMETWDDTRRFAVVLHQLRPLLMPSFTVDWIGLVSDKLLLYKLLKDNSVWTAMGVLTMDFAAALSLLSPKDNADSFDLVYKAFLRFILVLSHDFRQFVASVSSCLVSVIPFRFAQLRNIILSTCDKSFESMNCLFSSQDIEGTLPQRFTSAMKQLFANGSYDSNTLNAILTQLEQGIDPVMVRYFVVKICEGSMNLKKSDDVEDTQAFAVLSEAFGSISPDLATATVHILMDQLRYKSKESSFYVRLLFALFKGDVQVTPQLSLSEVVLRVALERAATPPPRPAKLGSLIRKLLAHMDTSEGVWSWPFVKANENIRQFLVAAQAVFASKQK